MTRQRNSTVREPLHSFDVISRLTQSFHRSCRPALLLEKEPTNLQAQSLSSLIDKGVARGTCPGDPSFTSLIVVPEGYIGMALAGGAAALGVIAVTALIRRATRK
jgi:hypothetical protein